MKNDIYLIMLFKFLTNSFSMHVICICNILHVYNLYFSHPLIFYQIIIDTFICNKRTTTFTLSFVNFFYEIANNICWSCYESCTINKFCFVRYSSNTFITILINFCDFFSIGTEKVFCVFPKTFKFSLKLIW